MQIFLNKPPANDHCGAQLKKPEQLHAPAFLLLFVVPVRGITANGDDAASHSTHRVLLPFLQG